MPLLRQPPPGSTFRSTITGISSSPETRSALLPSLLAVALSAALFPTGHAHAQSNEQLLRENAELKAEIARLREARHTPEAPAARTQDTPTAPEARADTSRATPPQQADNIGDAALLDAVIVKSEQIKELPASISAVTGEELEKFHVNNFRDIVNRLGNVRTSWQNPNTASIFVRGVGWAAGAGVLDPSVGVSMDGVGHGISSISALSNYLDIESVEVVRGPTGTEGGRAANVGHVYITTRKPGFAPEARATLTLGQLNTVIATAAIGGGIIEDTLAYRLTVNRETADGPYKNANDSHYTWRNTDRTNVRAQFLFTPNDRLEATLALDFTPEGREICENCFWFNSKTPEFYDWTGANGEPGRVNYAEDPYGKFQRRWFLQKPDYTIDDYYGRQVNTVGEYPNTYETRGGTVNIRYRLDDDTTLSSITGYRDYQFSQGAGSHTGFEWLRAPRGTQTSYEQLSQEFRIDTALGDAIDLQAGLHFFRGKFPNYSQTERYGADAGAWYANHAQYQLLDPSIPGLPDAADAAGRVLLLNSAHGLITQRKEQYRNDSSAAFSHLRWSATDALDLHAGLRISRESRNTTAQSGILSDGYAAELNPASVNNVILNGFASNAQGVLLAGNNAEQLALADFVAQKYFGGTTYAALSDFQRQQVGAAKAIRAARIGGLYLPADAEEYAETLFNGALGASYQVNDALTLHATWKYGEKPGISQIVGATRLGGKSVPAGTETTRAYEFGFKSLLLDNTLSLAGTVFLQDLDNYIQNTFVYDEVQTELNNDGNPAYLAALGNVPKVRTKGLELDVAYFGIPYTTVRFAGAYTDARYRDFPRAPNPAELGGANPGGAYYDASGKTLPGAPKVSGNLFVDFSYPVSERWAFQSNLNYNYQSSYYTDTRLSRYARTDALGVTDFSIGLGRQDGRFAVSLVARNVFDTYTGVPLTWNSDKPGIPRWIGATIQASLY